MKSELSGNRVYHPQEKANKQNLDMIQKIVHNPKILK